MQKMGWNMNWHSCCSTCHMYANAVCSIKVFFLISIWHKRRLFSQANYNPVHFHLHIPFAIKPPPPTSSTEPLLRRASIFSLKSVLRESENSAVYTTLRATNYLWPRYCGEKERLLASRRPRFRSPLVLRTMLFSHSLYNITYLLQTNLVQRTNN